MIWQKRVMSLFLRPDKQKRRPVRLSARTAPFHGAKTGSIPVPATKSYQKPLIILLIEGFLSQKVTVSVTVFQIVPLLSAILNKY